MTVETYDSRFLSVRGEPFDLIAELAQGWDLEYDQVTCGPNFSEVIQVRLDGVDVAWECLGRTVVVAGSPPPGSVAFGLRAIGDGPWMFRGREAGPETLGLVRPGDDLDLRFQGGLLSFVADRALLEERLGSSAFQSAFAKERILLPLYEAEALRGVALAVLRAVSTSPQLLDSAVGRADLAEAILAQLELVLCLGPHVEEFPRRHGPPPVRLEAARKAAGLIRGRLHTRIAIPDLAEQTEVGERALRTGFNQRYGHGPKAHIRLMRLNAIRRALRSASSAHSVTWVAARHGVEHFGRFARRYRELFGESPSDTLRRAKAGNRSESG